MKIKFIILLLLTNIFCQSQCGFSVTQESGIQNVNGVNVTITSFGMTYANAYNCATAAPYLIGKTIDGVNGDGGFIFNFSPPISQASLSFYAIDNIEGSSEEIEIFINGNHYFVPQILDVACTQTLAIVTANGNIGDSFEIPNASSCQNVIIPGPIDTLTVYSHVIGSPLGSTLGLKICTPVLGVENLELNDLVIFPIPIIKNFSLQSTNALQNATLLIYNLLGQKVKEINGIYGNIASIDCTELANNTYVLKIIENDICIKEKKIIVCH